MLEVPVENNRRIILVIGGAAVVLAALLYIAFLPESEEVIKENPYVKQLESEVELYAAQVDSMNAVVEDLNARIDVVRTQMDSARASNKVLLATLHRVTNASKEYQRLYKEQRSLNDKLRSEIAQVTSERDLSTTQVTRLRTSVDSLNTELYEQTIRITRIESSLEEALQETEVLRETVHSILVYIGTEDALKRQGYLNTSRFIRKSYKITNFPDINSNDVIKVGVGETFTLQGELAALCDRHGKLGKGKEYELSKSQSGQTLISFSDPMLAGQRILAILKP
jgi:peptidoglycan hydrolase CwlO-like protein